MEWPALPLTRAQVSSLFSANERLAFKVVHRFKRCGVEFEDLEQEARIALVRAIETFDPTNAAGATFGTYAYRVIANALTRLGRMERARKRSLVGIEVRLDDMSAPEDKGGSLLHELVAGGDMRVDVENRLDALRVAAVIDTATRIVLAREAARLNPPKRRSKRKQKEAAPS